MSCKNMREKLSISAYYKHFRYFRIVFLIVLLLAVSFSFYEVSAVDYPNTATLNPTNMTDDAQISTSFKTNLNKVYDLYHEYADKFSAVNFTKDNINYSDGTFISNITYPLNLTPNFSVSQAYAPQKRNICIFQSNVKDDSPQHNEVTYGRLPIQGFVNGFLGLGYTLVTETDIATGSLNNCHVFLIPAIQHGPEDNVTKWLEEIEKNLTPTGLSNIKNFVNNGGLIFAESDGMYLLQRANITGNNTITNDSLKADERLYGSASNAYIQFKNFTNPASFGYNSSNVSAYTIGDPMINLSADGNLTSVANFSGKLIYQNGSSNNYTGTAIAYKDFGNGRVYLSAPHLTSNVETHRALAFIITYGISERMEFERNIKLIDLPSKYYDNNGVLVIPALEPNINLTVPVIFGNTWNETLTNVTMRININPAFNLSPDAQQTFCDQINKSSVGTGISCTVNTIDKYIEVNFSTLNPGLFNATYKISTNKGLSGLTNVGDVSINFTDVNGQNRTVYQNRLYVNAMTRADLKVDKQSPIVSPLAPDQNYSSTIDIGVQNKGETPAINAIISDIIPNEINITVTDENGTEKNVTVSIDVTCPSGWTKTNVIVYNYTFKYNGKFYPVINATNCSTVMNVSPHDNIDPVGQVHFTIHTPPKWWDETGGGCTNNPPCAGTPNLNCTWFNVSNLRGDSFPFNLGGKLFNNATVGESNTSKVDYSDVWDRNFTSPLRELKNEVTPPGLPHESSNMTVTKSIYMTLPDGRISDVLPSISKANVTIEIAIYPHNDSCVVFNRTTHNCSCNDTVNKTAYCINITNVTETKLLYLEDTIPKGVSYNLTITNTSYAPSNRTETPFYNILSWRNISVPCGEVYKIYINATLDPLGTEGELTVNKGGSYMYYDRWTQREAIGLLPIDSVRSEYSSFTIAKGTHPSLLPPGGQGKHVYHSIEIYDPPETHLFMDPFYHSWGFKNGTVRTYTGGTLLYSTTSYSSIVNSTNNFTIIQLEFANTGNKTWNISSLNITNITMRHQIPPTNYASNFNITPNFNLPIIVEPGQTVIEYFNVTYNGTVPNQMVYEVNFNWTAENVPENFSISPAKIGVGSSPIYDYYDYGRDIIISDKLRSGVKYNSTRYIHGACPIVINETTYSNAKSFNYTYLDGNPTTGTNITWNLTQLKTSWNNTITLPYVVNESGTFITQPRFCILIDSLWLGGSTGTYPINLGANVNYTDNTWNENKNASSNVPETDVHGPLINVTKEVTDIYTFIPPENTCQYIYPYDPNRPNFTEPYPRIPYNLTSMVCMMIYVRNDGDAIASNVTLTDVLPPNSTYINNSLSYQGCNPPSPRDSYRLTPKNVSYNTPSPNYTTLNYSISDIAPGGTYKILVCVNVTPNETNSIAPGDNITINEPVNATFMSDLFPGEKFNTSNHEELNASSNETILSINKTANIYKINATVPTLINLTINVTNIGFVMAEHVYIIDDIPLFNSTYQMTADVINIDICFKNSTGIYCNNTCNSPTDCNTSAKTGKVDDVNYTYYGYFSGTPNQDGYKYTLKYRVLSNLTVGSSFLINVTLNLTVNLSAEKLRLNYNPLTWADNAILKEGPPVVVNVTVFGPRLNISKKVERVCPSPIDKTCVAACSNSGNGSGDSWANATCLISQDNVTEGGEQNISLTGNRSYKYVLDGWSYVNITVTSTLVTGELHLYTSWNGTYPNSTSFDCHNSGTGLLITLTCVSPRPLPPGTYYVLENLTGGPLPPPSAENLNTTLTATCYSDQCWNKPYMIADQANPNNTLDLLFNVSNNLPWQEATLTAYNVTIYDQLQNFVKVWDFNRWNNTPNNTKIYYKCSNGTNGTLNIIKNNNDLDNGILNFTVDSDGLKENCSLYFNVSVTYAPPCASNADENYSGQDYCNPYWTNSSIYNQSNHYYILNIKPRVKAEYFNWNEGNNLTEEIRWKKPYFNVTKTANTTTAEPGDYVNFTINITNTGNSTVYELNVTDYYPTGFNYVSSSWTSNLSRDVSNIVTVYSGNPLTWRIWNLTVNETITINVKFYVTSSAGNVNGKLNKNNVSVWNRNESYEDNINVTENSTADVTVYTPNIKVSKVSDGDTEPGDFVTFKIVVNNLNLTQNHSTLYNISIKDVLPKCWDYNNTINITYKRSDTCIYARFPGPPGGEANASNVVSNTTSGDYMNVTWNLVNITNLTTLCSNSFNDSQLHPNETIEIYFNIYVRTCSNKSPEGANVTNLAIVQGYDGDNSYHSFNGSTNVTVYEPHLTLTKTTNVTKAEPHEKVNFCLNITNPSKAKALNLIIADTLPKYWNYSYLEGNTTITYYRTNVSLLGLGIGILSGQANYTHTWNETKTNVAPFADGLNLTWNLSLYSNQTTTACYLSVAPYKYMGNSSAGNCSDVFGCTVATCTPYQFNDTQLNVNDSVILCFDARVETHENKTQVVSNVGMVYYTDGDNGENNGTGSRYVAIGDKSLVENQPYLVLYKIANQSITEPGGNNSNSTLFTLNVTNPSNATAYNISVVDLLPVGWQYNNTVNITYIRNITVCVIDINGETCNNTFINYTRTWNENDINILQRADNGYNVTWNLSKLGPSDHQGVTVGLISVNVTCDDAALGPNSCNCSCLLGCLEGKRCRAGTGEYLEIRFISTTWANASGGINGTGAENQNNVTAYGFDGYGTPINRGWIVNGTANVTVVEPYLIIEKTINNSPVGIGEYAKFSLNVTNIGNGTAISVNVTDEMPNGFVYNNTTYVKIGDNELNVTLFEKCNTTTSLTCCNSSINSNAENTYYYNNSCNITIQTTPNKQNVTWNLNATLYPNTSILINFSAYVSSNAKEGNNTNFAYTNGTFLSGEQLGSENKANITINFTVCKPNLTVSKEIIDIDSETKRVNITVKNIGCGAAYDVEISDDLPIGWIYSYTSRVVKKNASNAIYDIPYSIVIGNPVIWRPYDSTDPSNSNPDLYANESISVIFYVKITEDARQGNNTDYVNVSYKDADNGTYFTNTSNNSQVQTPMEISKFANMSNVKNGDYVNFTIHVKNPIQRKDPITGNEINFPEGCIYNLTIIDKLPETWTFITTTKINATLTYPTSNLIFNPITPPDYTELYNSTTNEIKWILHRNYTDPYNNSLYNNSFCPQSELWIEFKVLVGDNVPINGLATNYVNVTGKNGNGSDWTVSENSISVNVTEEAFLNITKEILNEKQSYNIGDTIEFLINVSNPMANVLYNVTVNDELPCGLIISNYNVDHNTSQYSCTVTNKICGTCNRSILICKFDNLSPYNYTLIYLNATVLECMSEGSHSNYVKVDAFRPGKIYEKHDLQEFTIAPFQGDVILDAQKSIGNYISGAFEPGDKIIFTLKASNFGKLQINNITFTDELPPGLVYDHYSSSPLNIVKNVSVIYTPTGGQQVTFEINETLEPGSTFTVFMYTNVTHNISEGTNVNKLIVEGKQPNGANIRDEDSKPFVVGKPKLSMTKKALNKTAKPGEEVTYVVTIKNEGTGMAYNLNISDMFPSNWNKTFEQINITPLPQSKVIYFDFNTGNSPFFGQSNSPTASGYIPIYKDTIYSIERGYGWNTTHVLEIDSYDASFNYSKHNDLNPDRDRDYHHQDGDNTFIIDLPTKIKNFIVRTVFCNPNASYQHIYVNITTSSGNYVVLSNANITPGDCFINTTSVSADGQLNVTFFSYGSNWMINAIMIDTDKLSGLLPGQTANITYILKIPENESCGNLFANDINVKFEDGDNYSQSLEARDDVLTVCDTNLVVDKYLNFSSKIFAPGDVVPFIINISNNGFNNLYNVTVYDDIPTGTKIKNISYYNGTDIVSTTTFPITIPELKGNNYTIVSLYLNVTNESFGEKKNHVFVKAQKAGGEHLAAEDDEFFILEKPELSITKENLVPYAHPGENIVYQVTIKNEGNTVAKNVQFLDSLPDNFSVISLNSTCIEPLKFDFGPEDQKVKEGWINITPSTKYSSAKGYGFSSDSDVKGLNTSPSIDDPMMNDSIQLWNIFEFLVDVQNGNYNITLYYDNSTYNGADLFKVRINGECVCGNCGHCHEDVTNYTYNLNVTNGRINITSDQMSVHIRGIEIKLLFTPTNVLNYSIGDMQGGKECKFIYNVTIPEGTPDGVYYNNASVSWKDGLNNTFIATAKDDVDVHNLGNLDINKTIVNVNHKFETGDVITFRVDVRNTGVNTIYNLTFEDRLPLGVEFLHLSPEINKNVTIIDEGIRGQVLRFNLENATGGSNNLNGNSTKTFYMYAKVHSNASGGKNFNYINVKGYDINGKELTDSSLVEFDIGKSHVQIRKKALNKTAKPGDIIYYEVELENIGDATAYGSKIYNITLLEELPENWTITSSKLEYIPAFATIACYDFSANKSEITGRSWSPIEPGCYPVYKEWYNETRGYGYWWANNFNSVYERDYDYEDDSLRDYHYSSENATLRFDIPNLLNKTINVTLYFFSVDTSYTFDGVDASEDNVTWQNVVGFQNISAGNLTVKTFQFNTTTKQLYLKFLRYTGNTNDWFINKMVIQYIGFANASVNETITIPVLVPKQKAKFTFGVKVPDYECDGSFANYAKMSYGDKEVELGQDYAKDDVLIKSEAFLNITKEILNEKQTYNINDVIQFKINVSNPYINQIYNVSLIDNLPCGLHINSTSYNITGGEAGSSCSVSGNECGNNCGMKLICNLGTLNGSSNIVVYLNATVKDCMIEGPHSNYVKVEGRRCNKTYEKHDMVEFSVVKYAEFMLTKESNVSPDTILQPGDNVTYTITLINTGDINLTVNVTDIPPTGFSCNKTNYQNVNVLASSTVKIYINCYISSNASEGANVNEVYVNGTAPGGKIVKDQATSTVTVAKPKLSITKQSLSEKVVPGSSTIYRINIINEGRANAKNITIIDILPNGWTFEQITTNGCNIVNETQQGNIIRFVNGSVSAMNECYFEFNVSVPLNETTTLYHNKFNATYLDNDNTTYTIPTQIDNGVTVSNLMIYVEKFVNVTNAQPGDKVKFTIKVKNIGNVKINVTLNDIMPSGFSYVNNTAKFVDNGNIANENVSFINNYLNISIGEMKVGEEMFVEFEALINDSASEGANKNKIIAIASNENKQINSTSYAYLTIYKPQLAVIKSASNYFVGVGDEVEFTITILNPSYANLYNITVNDTLPSGFNYTDGSSKLNGITINDPIKTPNSPLPNQRQNLVWNVSVNDGFGVLNAKTMKVLTYRAKVVHCNITQNMYNEVNVSGIYKNGEQNVIKAANTSVKIAGLLANATLVKYANKDIVSWFDVVEFTIIVKVNVTGGSKILPLNLTDHLPQYLQYINNSAIVGGEPMNPNIVGNRITGQNLTWYLNDILLSPGSRLVITYRALTYPGINNTFTNRAELSYIDPTSGEILTFDDNADLGTVPNLPNNEEINKRINNSEMKSNFEGINKGIASSAECINANILHLKKGWNLISLPTQPINNTIEEVLKSIKYTDVFTYDNGWIYKTKYNNKWFGNLKTIDVGRGYWIKVEEDCNLTIVGYYIDNWKIKLYKGWNLIGMIGCENTNTENVVFTNGNKISTNAYSDIFTYENSKGWIYKSKYNNKWFGSLDKFEQGKGYWIKVDNEYNMSLIT